MKTQHIGLIALLLASSVACKEEVLQPYQGDSYIYFATSDKQQPQVDFSFAYFPNSTDTSIAIPMILWGNLFQQDYSYKLNAKPVGNFPAQENVDFSFQTTHIFRKNSAIDSCYITLNKTSTLINQPKTLALEIVGAVKSKSGIYPMIQIRISDEIARPAWWTTATKFNSLGAYSDIKLRQLIIFKGKNINLEADSSFAISTLAKEFKAYLITQWAQGNRIYAEDGKKPLHETLGV